jgi:hypothetical protein
MAMYRILYLLAFIFLVQPDSSATSIAGSATELAGGELFIYRLDDAFVNRQSEITSVSINDDGSFKVDFPLSSPHLIRLYCREWMGEFYAFPNADYTVELRKPTNAARKFCDNMLNVFVSSPHAADANMLMSQFQNEMEVLFNESFFDLAKQQSKGNSGYRKVQRERLLRTNLIEEEDDDEVVEMLADSTSLRFNAFADRVYSWMPANDAFTEQLLLTSLASLDHTLGKSPERIASDYPTIKTDLTNPEFVRLFRQLNFAPLAKRNVSPSKWEDLLISMAPADSIFKALDPTGTLNNEELSMLALLALEQTPSFIDFSKKKTQAVIARFSTDPILGKQCSSILENSMQGTRADAEALPNVVLLNNSGDRINLVDFNGGLVYLFFVDSSMPSAQKEISALSSLISKWTSKMTFVIVEMGEGKSIDALQSLARSNKIELLRSGNTPAIRHHFNLKSIPTGYLVDTDNKFIDDVTPLPADGLPYRLEQLFMNEKKGNGRTWRD